MSPDVTGHSLSIILTVISIFSSIVFDHYIYILKYLNVYIIIGIWNTIDQLRF